MLQNEPSCRIPIFTLVFFASLLLNDSEGDCKSQQSGNKPNSSRFSPLGFFELLFLSQITLFSHRYVKDQHKCISFSQSEMSSQLQRLYVLPAQCYSQEKDVRGFMSVVRARVTGNLSSASFFVLFVLHLCMCMLSTHIDVWMHTWVLAHMSSGVGLSWRPRLTLRVFCHRSPSYSFRKLGFRKAGLYLPSNGIAVRTANPRGLMWFLRN